MSLGDADSVAGLAGLLRAEAARIEEICRAGEGGLRDAVWVSEQAFRLRQAASARVRAASGVAAELRSMAGALDRHAFWIRSNQSVLSRHAQVPTHD